MFQMALEVGVDEEAFLQDLLRIQSYEDFLQFQKSNNTKVVRTGTKTGPSLFNLLNDECLLHILSFIVRARDILDVEAVCQRWQKLGPELWKAFCTFDITSKELGYRSYRESEGEDINLPMCKQVFSRCWKNLTTINLSRLQSCQTMTLMDLTEFCELPSPSDKGFRKNKSNDEKVQKRKMLDLEKLVECENIEELWLCRCIMEVDDAFLEQVFQKNKKLRLLYLSKYRLDGKCFSAVSLEAMKSLFISNCVIQDSSYLNSVIGLASKIHSLCASDVQVPDHSRLRISSPHLLQLRLDDTWKVDFIPDIRKFKNLTVLSLANSELNDISLEIIIKNCAQLTVLNLSWNRFLTDISLHNLSALLHLKYLSLGCNDQFTDKGLLALGENLQILDITDTKFSENTLIKKIEKMQDLQGLEITECKHLKTSFVDAIIGIVKTRPSQIPLEIAMSKRSINKKKLKNKCSLVKLIDPYKFHNFEESVMVKYCKVPAL